jgi:cephalosporin hydroxylase
MGLWDLFQNNSGRIIHKWTHYFPIYERYFHQYIGKPVLFIEIGVDKGGSLQMWKKCFGPLARIVGIDIMPDCKEFEEEQIHIRIGDQSDPMFLQEIIEEFDTPDIVLDDGSHVMTDIISSFNFLYPRIDRRGIYMVEDLHTAYWDEYQGGLDREGTFIEKCKILIDELNAEHTRGKLKETDFSKTTLSMHFYDSVVVFEKGSYGKKYAPQIGRP